MLTTDEDSIKLTVNIPERSSPNDRNPTEKATVQENYVTKILQTDVNKKKKKKNLYQNIGTRVSQLREINENYQSKIRSQEDELHLLDERIQNKLNILQVEMRDNKKLEDPAWVKERYDELVRKGEIKMKVNFNHVQNDPELKKVYQQKQAEVSSLQTKLNNLIKKTDSVKSEINVLRVENSKIKINLDDILQKKEIQCKEMDKISEEANKYLKEKGNINQQLVELNSKIDNKKTSYENKMQELNKMIDNTKKIKEFHENLALEKFSKNTFRKTAFGHSMSNSMSNSDIRPTNKIVEEQNHLVELTKELKAKKAQTVYLNLCRFILFKKGQELNKVIEKIKSETGVENLESLSKYLELSTKTNKLFETDLKSLNEQKQTIEKQIEDIRSEIQKAQCILNDTSTKKFEYLDKLSDDLKKEEETKDKLNKKLYMLNRVIDLLANGFKEVCIKLNFFDKNLKLDAEVRTIILNKIFNKNNRIAKKLLQNLWTS
jgi:chromosome segregation ATPase